MLAQMFKCPKHGQVWRVQIVEDIDTVNDEVYSHTVCELCGNDVTQMFYEGVPVFHALSEDEIYWEQFSPFDDEEEWEEES